MIRIRYLDKALPILWFAVSLSGAGWAASDEKAAAMLADNNAFWGMITAIGTSVTASVAIVTAVILVWQTRSTVSNQAILQILEFWQSEPIYPQIRGEAAKAAERDVHVDDVLDFFETVAFLTKRHRIDPSRIISVEMTHNTFIWPMVNYWILYKNDIHGLVWSEYSHLIKRLILFEELKLTPEEASEFEKNLTEEKARKFMEGERFRCSVAPSQGVDRVDGRRWRRNARRSRLPMATAVSITRSRTP